ncbi:hypothetical protein DEDE109153_11515 [Deinococcus deserti]|uniref:DUF2975 domain-containing protein n=1 Tax=Deinococcus deserti (strain DSM 17065 / CIP 109153 / LMG 22923 / VCD115) TaxID=546414 RepID=C1CXV7_DEIDV|nr:hypothetical protein [Deinococcus deserti]ACO46913.1 Hypothetical protein; putative membrane protein [Deinococcus deserti VCD115]
MLHPESARIVLNWVLNLGMLFLVLFSLGFLWTLLTGSPLSHPLSFAVPVGIALRLDDQHFRITEMSVTLNPPVWIKVLGVAASLGLLTFLFVAYSRVKTFFNRLMFDPFDPANIRDLHLAARIALFCQVLVLIGVPLRWWAIQQAQPYDVVHTALKDVPDASVFLASRTSLGALSVLELGVAPLLTAAVLAIFAAVLQQACVLREEERKLRHEHELTV